MEYLALYRKYRPSKFDEFYGQKNIVNIIKNSLSNNKISHAYLFSGPRGTGKTSMAKLIAKIINCSDFDGVRVCDNCNSCNLINDKSNPDVIEIDAASNNGVDEIRNLRDKVTLSPAVSKYKVYIIDEVHMLSSSAFNALLKTIEEPPKHVVFILATTELYKVPETIVSRCQCYEFERIGNSEIVDCLKKISNEENINIESNVFDLISRYCNGGLRDAIGVLDKLSSCSDYIDVDLFYNVVGVVEKGTVEKIVLLMLENKRTEILNILENLSKKGKNVFYLVEQIMEYLKTEIVNNSKNSNQYVIMLEHLNDVLLNFKNSFNHLLTLEIGILKILVLLNENDKNISREIICDTKNVEKDSEIIINKKENESDSNNKQKFDSDIRINNAFALANKELKTAIVNKWNEFNNYIHNKEFSSVASLFLDSKLEVAGEKDIIISVENEAMVQNANTNLVKLELLFNLVIGNFYNIAVVTENYFSELRKKYISDIKSGKKYEYIDSKEKNNDIILDNDVVSGNELVESAQNIFGNDIVEIV